MPEISRFYIDPFSLFPQNRRNSRPKRKRKRVGGGPGRQEFMQKSTLAQLKETAGPSEIASDRYVIVNPNVNGGFWFSLLKHDMS